MDPRPVEATDVRDGETPLIVRCGNSIGHVCKLVWSKYNDPTHQFISLSMKGGTDMRPCVAQRYTFRAIYKLPQALVTLPQLWASPRVQSGQRGGNGRNGKKGQHRDTAARYLLKDPERPGVAQPVTMWRTDQHAVLLKEKPSRYQSRTR